MSKRKRSSPPPTPSTPVSLIPNEDERRVLNAAWDAAALLSPEERADIEAWCASEYAPSKLAARREEDAKHGGHPWREAPWPLQAFLTEGDFLGVRDRPENKLAACLGAAVADVLRDGSPLGLAADRRNWAKCVVWLARTLTDPSYELAGVPWMSDDPSRLTCIGIWDIVAGEDGGIRASWFELVAAAVDELTAGKEQESATPALARPAGTRLKWIDGAVLAFVDRARAEEPAVSDSVLADRIATALGCKASAARTAIQRARNRRRRHANAPRLRNTEKDAQSARSRGALNRPAP